MNRAAQTTEHLSKEDVFGNSLLAVFPGARNTGLFQTMQRVWKRGETEHIAPVYYEDERIAGWREYDVYAVRGRALHRNGHAPV